MTTKLSEYKLFNELAVDFGPQSGDWGSALLFLYGLALGCKAKNILEVGHGLGGTTSALLLSGANVLSIDIKAPHSTFLESIEDTEYKKRWDFKLGDSRVIMPWLPSMHFDFILLDGEHSYEAVEQELFNCKKLAVPGATIVLDDCHEDYAPGVVRAFKLFESWRPIKKSIVKYGNAEKSFHGANRILGIIQFLD